MFAACAGVRGEENAAPHAVVKSQPLPYKQDEDVVPGVTGVSLVLLVVAVFAMFAALRRRRGGGAWLTRALGGLRASVPPDARIAVSPATAIHPAVRLHVVEWDGGRLLVATNASGNVTVLQTIPGGSASATGEAVQ